MVRVLRLSYRFVSMLDSISRVHVLYVALAQYEAHSNTILRHRVLWSTVHFISLYLRYTVMVRSMLHYCPSFVVTSGMMPKCKKLILNVLNRCSKIFLPFTCLLLFIIAGQRNGSIALRWNGNCDSSHDRFIYRDEVHYDAICAVPYYLSVTSRTVSCRLGLCIFQKILLRFIHSLMHDHDINRSCCALFRRKRPASSIRSFHYSGYFVHCSSLHIYFHLIALTPTLSSYCAEFVGKALLMSPQLPFFCLVPPYEEMILYLPLPRRSNVFSNKCFTNCAFKLFFFD